MNAQTSTPLLMLFISAHVINIGKQSQLTHSVIVCLFIFFVHLVLDMFLI
jgi:hypothetical protein